MRALLLLLSLCVWVGCAPVSSMERAKQEARGRLLMQETNQDLRQLRNACQEILDMEREALALTQTEVALVEQVLTYKAEATHLIKQQPPGARERAREISAALRSINTQLLAIAAEFHAKSQRIAERTAQLETIDMNPLKKALDLPAWAIDLWAIEQGRRTLAEVAILTAQAAQVRHTRQPLQEQIDDLREQLKQDPLDSLIDRLEQIAI